MKLRNGVLMMTATVLVLQASGQVNIDSTTASDQVDKSIYDMEMNYTDISVSTPNAYAIHQLKELGLLDMGESYQPNHTITYGHLAYLLGESNFSFGKAGENVQSMDTFHVYGDSLKVMQEKGIFKADMQQDDKVTHEGLQEIVAKAFGWTSSDVLTKAGIELGTGEVVRHEVAHYFYQAHRYDANSAVETASFNKEDTEDLKVAEAQVASANVSEVSKVATKAVATKAVAATTVTSFKDVPTKHWAHQAIMGAVQKGYVNGYVDGTFKPEAPVAHSEFMKMLVVATGVPTSTTKGSSWYSNYLDAAISAGYYTKGEVTSIPWNNQMNRTDIINASLKSLKINPSGTKNWYLATTKGLIQGKDASGTLDVQGTLSRAEAITIIERVLQLKAGETLQVDKNAVNQAEVHYHGTNVFTVVPELFKPNRMDEVNLHKQAVHSPDGLYSVTGHKVIAVDLDNPKDPNMKYVKRSDLWTDPYYNNGKAVTKDAYAIVMTANYTSKAGKKSAVSGGYVGVFMDDDYVIGRQNNIPTGVQFTPEKPTKEVVILSYIKKSDVSKLKEVSLVRPGLHPYKTVGDTLYEDLYLNGQ